jgi:hypothetical protein
MPTYLLDPAQCVGLKTKKVRRNHLFSKSNYLLHNKQNKLDASATDNPQNNNFLTPLFIVQTNNKKLVSLLLISKPSDGFKRRV